MTAYGYVREERPGLQEGRVITINHKEDWTSPFFVDTHQACARLP